MNSNRKIIYLIIYLCNLRFMRLQGLQNHSIQALTAQVKHKMFRTFANASRSSMTIMKVISPLYSSYFLRYTVYILDFILLLCLKVYCIYFQLENENTVSISRKDGLLPSRHTSLYKSSPHIEKKSENSYTGKYNNYLVLFQGFHLSCFI